MSENTYNREQLYRTNLVTIYTEANPNPNSMKFMLNFMLLPAGESIDFPDKDSAELSPLAQSLFNFDFVERIFFMSNFITITKKESADWFEISPILKKHIKEYIEQGNKIFTKDPFADASDIQSDDSEAVKKIKSILEEYIKPAVEMDGGAIRFHSFDESSGLLRVELQGSCSGCPSSMVTLKAGIENLVKKLVPQVKEVVAEGI
ncbi:MAG: NifU family protein [Cytophagales bacterium]|nr:NifU family protein [Cytophagales bacterium]MDW8383272.1 NifU family protein [Flammeovirgaceae bacterium]